MGPAAYAQDGSDDLTSMTLEELMQIDIVPIGILEGHIHLNGQWMVGYQFMKMSMTTSGQPDGSYMMNPESMWMDMHMVMLMYGLTDDLTLMAMIPYQNYVMEMTDMKGMHMSSSSAGLRDILLMGHNGLGLAITHKLVEKIGGSIDVQSERNVGTTFRVTIPRRATTPLASTGT